jgi:ABC-2 type transport system ATP-binding protein
MQQKVQFVITVLHEPPLLIFDEPFSGFDPVNAELLKREILELRDKGHTIIFSTHNMSSVEEVCDEIALIDHSQVVLQGNVEEVKQRFCEGIYTVEGMSETLLETTAEYEVLSHQRVGHVDSYSIRAAAEMSGSQLIAHLAKKIEIQRFAIQLPTMQEIFLRVVGKSQE